MDDDLRNSVYCDDGVVYGYTLGQVAKRGKKTPNEPNKKFVINQLLSNIMNKWSKETLDNKEIK